MAMNVPKTTYQTMMKDGSRHYQGLEEAVYRNIKACKEFATITRSCFGPQGMNKIVINHTDKRYVTNDALTIMNEIELQHPAAKIISMAAKMIQQEVGDGSNLVIQFTNELLQQADGLLRMGLTPSDIIEGYKLACHQTLAQLDEFPKMTIKSLEDKENISKVVYTAVNSKQSIYADFLTDLIVNACHMVMTKDDQNFKVDSINTVKVIGGGVLSSNVVQGLVFKTGVDGSVTKVKDAKVAVFTVSLDLMSTETKGTVLLNTAKELSSFSRGEEEMIKKMMDDMKAAGINVIVTSDKAGDKALDFANRCGIMVIRLISKFDIQRVCTATTAVPLPFMRVPTQEELGHCGEISVSEYGNTQCIVFKQEKEITATSSIVLRGSSETQLDDMDRAIDTGVNAFKMWTRHADFVTGGGSTEYALGSKIIEFATTRSDMLQYSIERFGVALQVVPKILTENCGFDSNEIISKLSAVHSQPNSSFFGVDVDANRAEVVDMREKNVYENCYTKKRAFELAVHAANTILSVDQLIMAKPAGGPRVRGPGPMDQD